MDLCIQLLELLFYTGNAQCLFGKWLCNFHILFLSVIKLIYYGIWQYLVTLLLVALFWYNNGFSMGHLNFYHIIFPETTLFLWGEGLFSKVSIKFQWHKNFNTFMNYWGFFCFLGVWGFLWVFLFVCLVDLVGLFCLFISWCLFVGGFLVWFVFFPLDLLAIRNTGPKQ